MIFVVVVDVVKLELAMYIEVRLSDMNVYEGDRGRKGVQVM